MITYNLKHIKKCQLTKEGDFITIFLMDIDVLIGKNLKRLRTIKNLSQEHLAEMINTPATRLSAYENGREGMGKDIMTRICKALSVEPYEFFLFDKAPIIADSIEQNLLQTYRAIKHIDPIVADDVIKYGKWRLEKTEETEKNPLAHKSKRIRHTAGGR